MRVVVTLHTPRSLCAELRSTKEIGDEGNYRFRSMYPVNRKVVFFESNDSTTKKLSSFQVFMNTDSLIFAINSELFSSR